MRGIRTHDLNHCSLKSYPLDHDSLYEVILEVFFNFIIKNSNFQTIKAEKRVILKQNLTSEIWQKLPKHLDLITRNRCEFFKAIFKMWVGGVCPLISKLVRATVRFLISKFETK